ncbi:MAG: 50S ribosomal protein L25 [Candidatus Omnitrophota bacterium]|nr:50S ribosomal protein L25 [Candidatus Omnitrophota bacterium]
MERVQLETETRKDIGKEAARKLRKAGLVPVVCYGAGEKTLNLTIKLHDLTEVLHTARGENVIIDLKIGGKGGKTKTVIVKDMNHDPMKGDIRHVDFQHISLTKQIKVKVPIHTKGESPGIKEGGILEHILWEIEIECLPAQIPERMDVDISKLAIGDSVCIKELQIPENIKIIQDPEDLVVQVAAPKAEVVEEVIPGDEITEPEVIKKEEKEEVSEEEEIKKPSKPEEKPHKE